MLTLLVYHVQVMRWSWGKPCRAVLSSGKSLCTMHAYVWFVKSVLISTPASLLKVSLVCLYLTHTSNAHLRGHFSPHRRWHFQSVAILATQMLTITVTSLKEVCLCVHMCQHLPIRHQVTWTKELFTPPFIQSHTIQSL